MSRLRSRETFPHHWLPEGLELKTWEQIEPWYQKLLDQPIDSAAELEHWLIAAGELNAAVGQEGVERYIAMTCQTDDPEREAAYLAFVRDIEPKLKPIQNEIREPLPRLAAPRRACRATATASSTAPWRTAAPSSARPTSPARPQLAELEQQYQKIIGAMTVTFRGQERTLAQMAPFLEETDRARPPGGLGARRRAPARRTATRSTTCSTR